MKILRVVAIPAVLAIACQQVDSASSEISAQPEQVLEFPSFGEGVVFESDTVGYFSDLLGGVIYRFSTTTGEFHEWARSAQPNGHRILSDGTHVVADGEEHAVLRFAPHGRRLPPITHADGVALQRPNDITLDDAEGFYFTDFQAGTVHYVSASGTATTVATDLEGPNGIAVHPDGGKLYVGEGRPRRISRFTIVDSRTLGPAEEFVSIAGPNLPDSVIASIDGMTFDQLGNLYVTFPGTGGVHVVDPEGVQTRVLDAGMQTVANVAFGGAGLHELYTVGARDTWFVSAADRLQSPGPGVLARIDLSPVEGWTDRSRWSPAR